MKLQILSEIRRVKEIMGVKPEIINEQLSLLKALAKSGKAELKAELKNYLKTYANAMGVSVDEALEAFEKDYSEALLKNSDDEVTKVFDDYFNVVSKDYVDDLIGIYARTAPAEFAREVIGVELGKQNIPLYDKFMNPATKVNEKNINSVRNLLDNVKWRRENIYPITGAEQMAQNTLDDFAESIEKKINEYEKSLKSLDEWYDDVYLIDTKTAGKKPITREEFESQVKSIQTKFSDKSNLEIVQTLIDTAPNKQNAIEWINNTFRKKGGVGDAASLAADGTVKITKTGVEWLKTVSKIGLGGLAVIGILLAIFKPDFYVEIGQRYREAGSKYTETYNILVSRLGKNFTELPEDVKLFIGREFGVDQAKQNQTNPYIKDIIFTPVTETSTGELVIKMSDDSEIKYETSDDKTFNKVGQSETQEETDAQILEKWKVQYPNGELRDGQYYTSTTGTIGYTYNKTTKDFE